MIIQPIPFINIYANFLLYRDKLSVNRIAIDNKPNNGKDPGMDIDFPKRRFTLNTGT